MDRTAVFTAVQKHPRYRVEASVDVVNSAACVEQLSLENISLGGVFIKTTRPDPPGSTVRLRLKSTDDAVHIGLMGRVVHVIDAREADAKAHPAGMGVEFEGLSEGTQALLGKFVAGLVDAARRERARRAPVRFLPPLNVAVTMERAALAEVWRGGLQQGALWVEGPAAPHVRDVVTVTVGPMELHAEVVHIQAGVGFGLQLTDLDARRAQALSRFIDGTVAAIVVEVTRVAGPPLGKLLAVVRRLFEALDVDDPFGAVGLAATATDVDARRRCAELSRLFAVPRPDASPPQRARIEAAARAVAKLEPALFARILAMRHAADLACRPPIVSTAETARRLVADAATHQRDGAWVEARRALEDAADLVPDDVGVAGKLAALVGEIDARKAAELVQSADVFMQGVGMEQEAITRAREAARLTDRRDVRLLAIRILAKTGEVADAQLLAEELVDADPKDALALQMLLHVYERARLWSDAIRVGEALVRLRPGDLELQKRVRRIVEQVRRR